MADTEGFEELLENIRYKENERIASREFAKGSSLDDISVEYHYKFKSLCVHVKKWLVFKKLWIEVISGRGKICSMLCLERKSLRALVKEQ